MFCKIILLFTLFYGSLFELHDRTFNYDKRGYYDQSRKFFQKFKNSNVKKNESKTNPYNQLLDLGFFWRNLRSKIKLSLNTVVIIFSSVKIITAAVDPNVSNDFKIIPGLGNFGDRYFGTTLDSTPPRLSQMSPVHLNRPVFNHLPPPASTLNEPLNFREL